MFTALIAYPRFNPVFFHIGPLPIRWYALAYVTGLVLGWLYARWLVQRGVLWGTIPRPDVVSLDDLLVYVAFGVVLGGRIGYILFYNLPFYVDHPLDMLKVWHGGMAFHGGMLGSALGVWLFARKHKLGAWSVADICSAVVPVGLFLGRIANFIKPELWGRPTDVPWAMVFPGAGPMPRHPSQLYEAGLEGLALFIILHFAVRSGALKRPGLVTGLFGVGYGLARIISEFFREPDPQLGFLFGGATMGMLLSVPLILAGIGIVVMALRRRAPPEAKAADNSA